MNIELTYGDLANAAFALQNLAKISPMFARTRLILARNIALIDVELKHLDSVRMEKIKQYGEKDEQGNVVPDAQMQVRFNAENAVKYQQEMQPLLETKVTLDLAKISNAELGDCASPGDIIPVLFMIED